MVPWESDPTAFIAKAISPSEVVHVELNQPEQTAIVVVPDRQLSLAIGKEGQNARLAARLVGWRLDIKGLTEWEEIKEDRLRELEEQRRAAALEAAAAAAEEAEAKAEAQEAVAEAEAIVADAEQPVETAHEAETPVVLEAEPSVAEADDPALAEIQAIDEDALLEAMIREDDETAEEAADSEGLSVDDLASFTLDDVIEDEEEEEEDFFPELPEVPILTPDAGKIRFAEDLMGETRGGGRSGRRSRRNTGGGAGRGARRGGGR